MAHTSPPSSTTFPTVERERHVAIAGTWRRPAAEFILLFAAVWLLFYTAYVMLPFTRQGAVVIADAKFETLVKGPMFGPQDHTRVMAFGHSKMLTSLRPAELDAAMGNGFRSYNLGLPGDERFLPMLEAALEAGNVPTHVLLMLSWDDKLAPPSFRDVLYDDMAIVKIVVPFHYFPRDVVIFAFENRHRLAEAIRDVAVQRDGMLDERGYYFIRSQSLYKNDRLPDNYALPSDHPTQTDRRKIPERSFVRRRLEQLARQYGFQVLMVPMPFRVGQFAPAPAVDKDRLAVISDDPLIRVLGPDYFSYPPALFSDPQHMNPDGAQAYTADLARLLKNSGVFD
jgi:hypothetical protein